MHTVELYAKVRRAVMVDGLTKRAAAQLFGIHRNTVSKMLEYSVPPGYRRRQRPVSRLLGPYLGVIDVILDGDRQVNAKQRHTAKRIYERLRDEHGFAGSYTIVREYVAREHVRRREMFVPLSHRPGQAQGDFGEADAIVAGRKMRFHYFCLDLPHSDAIFVKAYPAETAEAFCDAHNCAFQYFGGVPDTILYDNTRLAVAKILGDGSRRRSKMFAELQSHYLFEDRFGRPGKGNDKGKVEGLVGYARRNFMVPIPVVGSLDELNVRLLDACSKRRQAILRGHTETIGQRLERDAEAFLPLPATLYDACHKEAGQVSSLSLVRYKTNDYSVPTRHGHQDVLIKGYVDRVEIICQGERIASHRRSYERADFIYEPTHYLALLETKPRALDQAAPLAGWVLPEPFHRLRRLLEARMGQPGRREYIQVLRLLETFEMGLVGQSIAQALQLGTVGFDAIKLLTLARLESRPAKLDLTLYPYLPRATVGATDARAYLHLLASAGAAAVQGDA